MSQPSVPESLARRRIVAQGLARPGYASPVEAVTAFGAMQGQDLPGVISSIALRLESQSPADVLAAFDAGEVVRGYPMRGTVFAVPAADVTWMTELCAGVPLRAQINRRSQIGLDDDIVGRARSTMEELLSAHPGGASRADLLAHWDSHGIPTASGCGYHLITFFMHSTVVCWGAWNGSDQNVVLSDAWLPADRTLASRFGGDDVAATAELLRRYLLTHGPAGIRDFAWWTKLPLRTIRSALVLIEGDLETDGELYWRPGLDVEVAAQEDLIDEPHLLPGFDELILGYPDRHYIMKPAHEKLLVPGNNGVFKRAALVDAQVAAIWRRTGAAGRRKLDVEPFRKPLVRHRKGWERRFGAFPFHVE